MQYDRNPPLLEATLAPEPLDQLEAWMADARAAGQIEPTAMALATATPDGQPSVRIVLFKGFHAGGLTFYTDYEGRKGRELAANARVSAVFWWDRLERQVRVEGAVERLPREVSRAYFESRPRESQIGAITSRQSEVVASRETLDARYAANEAALAGQPVPLPDRWGGYRLVPEAIEFWQGRLGRLHDRLRYRRAGGAWVVERLEP
ncbi:MAG TPA: pyridoxamine 5'-phosphate oxidase [Nevskiaceae bacterium]|nr:pyridoxamine 5'-phosphate oxidase [Nevskiaceae bacterium]